MSDAGDSGGNEGVRWNGRIISLSTSLCTGAAGQLIAAINVIGEGEKGV